MNLSQIIKYVYYFICFSFPVIATMFMWKEFTNYNKRKIKFRITISVLILSLIITILYFCINSFIRVLIMTVLLMVFFKYVFNLKIHYIIITPLLSQFILIISETIVVIFLSAILLIQGNDILNIESGRIISNLVIAILAVLISKIPIIKKLYNYLLKITNNIKTDYLLIVSLFIILIANMFSMITYYKIDFKYLLIFNSILSLLCFGIVFYSLKTKNNYIKISSKYTTTLNSLKEYEDMIDKYRIFSHENKNQLLLIRNMLPVKDIKTREYIDELLNNKIKDSDEIMKQVYVIPSGGLRGLIYSKILVMKEKNINYLLNISKNIKTGDLINKIDTATMLDICQILGVYIDNSIEEVEKLKIKNINIDIYLENHSLIISIANNFNKTIEIDKIEEKGYTTKNKNHGYGLFLANEIIKDNNKLSNEKKITKKLFTQILKIKM